MVTERFAEVSKRRGLKVSGAYKSKGKVLGGEGRKDWYVRIVWIRCSWKLVSEPTFLGFVFKGAA